MLELHSVRGSASLFFQISVELKGRERLLAGETNWPESLEDLCLWLGAGRPTASFRILKAPKHVSVAHVIIFALYPGRTLVLGVRVPGSLPKTRQHGS